MIFGFGCCSIFLSLSTNTCKPSELHLLIRISFQKPNKKSWFSFYFHTSRFFVFFPSFVSGPNQCVPYVDVWLGFIFRHELISQVCFTLFNTIWLIFIIYTVCFREGLYDASCQCLFSLSCQKGWPFLSYQIMNRFYNGEFVIPCYYYYQNIQFFMLQNKTVI